MKVVFLCNEYPPSASGGIGTFTKSLAESLADEGYSVHVVGLYPVDSATKEVAADVEVHRLPRARGASAVILDRLRLARRLSTIGRNSPIDLIEAPDFEGYSALLPPNGPPVVVRLHGSHTYFAAERSATPSRSVSSLEALSLHRANAIVSVSRYTAERTKALFRIERDVEVIHNAIRVSPHLQRKVDYSTKKMALYFGTLAEKKGVLALASAWRAFSAQSPGWILTVVGRDSVHAGRSVRQEMLALLGDAAESVRFSGARPHEELVSSLHEYDFVVLPSFSEAFALAPMEAMVVGVPVIGSSLSSGAELIDDDVDGWLCDPREPSTIVRALSRAAASESDRERIGRSAARKIEGSFSYSGFIQRNQEFYEAVSRRALSQRRSRRGWA